MSTWRHCLTEDLTTQHNRLYERQGERGEKSPGFHPVGWICRGCATIVLDQEFADRLERSLEREKAAKQRHKKRLEKAKMKRGLKR